MRISTSSAVATPVGWAHPQQAATNSKCMSGCELAMTIECALVVGYEGAARYAGNSREILTLALDRPWMVPLPYLAVAAPPAVEELRDWRALGVVGYAIYLQTERDGMTLSDWPTDTLAELSAQRAILSFNATPGALARASEVIAAIDGARVIFSHLGLPGRSAAVPTAMQARERLQPLLKLASRPNAAVKLSGLYAVSDPPHKFPNDAAQPFVQRSARHIWATKADVGIGLLTGAGLPLLRPGRRPPTTVRLHSGRSPKRHGPESIANAQRFIKQKYFMT